MYQQARITRAHTHTHTHTHRIILSYNRHCGNLTLRHTETSSSGNGSNTEWSFSKGRVWVCLGSHHSVQGGKVTYGKKAIPEL